MYYDGRGVPQDYAKAVAWYQIAAELGLAEAQCNLSVMYYDGKGVPQDYAKAAAWCQKAAEQGDALAQRNLSVMFLKKEIGENADVLYLNKRAVYWLEKAAAQNDATALYNLGCIYLDGMEGVSADRTKALDYLEKAKDLGHDEANRLYWKALLFQY